MTVPLARILLWLFAIDLGIAFGAGLYEARVSFSDWLVTTPGSEPHWNAEAARLADTRLFTFSYFIPTMVGLMEAPDTAESVATAARWASLNQLRHGLILFAWLGSMKALSLLASSAQSR